MPNIIKLNVQRGIYYKKKIAKKMRLYSVAKNDKILKRALHNINPRRRRLTNQKQITIQYKQCQINVIINVFKQ